VFPPNFAEILAILRNILGETRVKTGIDLISVSDPLRPRLSQSRKIGRDGDETKVYKSPSSQLFHCSDKIDFSTPHLLDLHTFASFLCSLAILELGGGRRLSVHA
jgi:hypothetical protein